MHVDIIFISYKTLKTVAELFFNFVSGALMTLNISMYLTYLLPLGIHRVHAYFYMYMIDHFEYLHDI